MKSIFAVLAALITGFFLLSEAHALPPDLAPPPAAFGDAERDGTLLVTDDVREADFGGGLRLPVRWVYRSNYQGVSFFGWEGFSLTMLEARAVKKTDVLYEATFLCGKVIYFNKKLIGGTWQWKSNDEEWTGVEDGVKFTVTRWDGWQLEYQGGRITKLVTEDNRTLLWSYDSVNPYMAVSVKESGDDPLVTVGLSADPLIMQGSSSLRGAHTLTVNGDVYTFTYAGGTLRDIEFPDGRKTQWRFEDNGTSASGGPDKRLTLTQENGWWRSWVFGSLYRKLRTDDVWNYTITGGGAAADGVVYDRPTMLRTRIATGEIEKVEYEAANSLTISTDALGNITKSYRYKTSGKLYDKIYKIERKRSGESSFATIWRGTYDSATGDLIRSYDAGDNETGYVFERFTGANPAAPPWKVTTTDPLGRVSVVERNEEGDIVKTTSPAGVVRHLEWDSRHRLTRIKNAANEVLLRYVYGDKDQVLERCDALGNKTEYEYTVHLGAALLAKVTTPEGRVTEWTRDTKGRATKIESPSGVEWDYTYVDDWDVVEKITDPLNQETEFEYDTRLNEIKVTDALNNETETEYDDLDLPKEVTDALNQVTKLEWNANGDMKKLTDPRNKDYDLAWASAGKRKELQWPDTVKQTVAFDSEGKVTTFQPRGTDATITNGWNAAKEVTGQGWVNGSQSGTSSLTRNSVGQINGASTTAQTLTVSGTFAYNGEGRLGSASQTVGSVTRSAGLTYDLNGAIKTITYPAGYVVEYVRNGDGQVTAIKSGTTTIASYGYDTAGRLSTRTLSSGVVTTYSYDRMDRLEQIMVASGSAALWAQRYGYNAAGERIYTLKGSTGTVGDAYWLDATSQLVGVKYGATGANGSYSSASSPAGVGTWQYDAAGNRTAQIVSGGTTSYTGNDINQYATVNTGTLTYTGRGDLATQDHWEYTYDAFGNLIQAHNANMNVLAKYWRDAFGHRAVKDVDGSKTVYFNLGTSQLEAYDVTTATASSTIYEPGIDRPLAEVSNIGTLTFYHQDWLGSVAMLSDASGAKVQTYAYDAWGKPSGSDSSGTSIADASVASRFLFTAREFDRETALYHYRARAYSSELGRFIQSDPIDFSGEDYNLLRYVANDPLNYVDPTGEFAFVIPIIVTAPEWGPIAGGAAISGLAALGAWELWEACIKSAESDVPGVPTEDDGYVPPKKPPGSKDGKVPNPNGSGRGYPDKKGDVWVPTGPGQDAHGGPHWDVQSPGGGHRNVYPGGRMR